MPSALQAIGWVYRPQPILDRWRREHGDMFTMRIPSEPPWVMLSDPEAVKTVFRGDPRLLHAGAANEILRPVVGDHSILLLDEATHMKARKLLLPPFHGERMQRHQATMEAAARREVERWPLGETFALHPRMQALTLEVIVRVVFGVTDQARFERLRDALNRFLDTSLELRTIIGFTVLGPARMRDMPFFRNLLQPVQDLLVEEIRARRGAPDLAERDDVLSMLVQAHHDDGTPMGDEELRDELMTLLIAGHETTATALAWALERLVRNPAQYGRLRAAVREGGDDEYVDAVIQETLRRKPVLPIVLRLLKEPMEIGGRLLPAGVAVAPSIHLIHHREDIYPEPFAFRPERFLEQAPGTYTWIPFGGGVRRCLGASFALLEMKVVLRAVLQTLDLAPASPAPERITRRLITWTPARGGEVVARAA